VQSRGSEKVEAYPGQTIYCPPGEENWHSAAAESFMEHLAMLDTSDDPTVANRHATPARRHSPNGSGYGLVGMRERVTAVRGDLHVSGRDNTFQITASLPTTHRRSG
jgi:hypothetical protein